MTTITTACARCGAPLERPATGRPPTYCGEPCRRLTEREIARIDSQLDSLERQATKQRTSPALRWSATLEDLEAEHARLEARLRELLSLADAARSAPAMPPDPSSVATGAKP